MGYRGELRFACRTATGTWGFDCLLRDRHRPEFGDDEAAFISDVTGVVADGLRRAAMPIVDGDDEADGPLVVLFDIRDRALSATSAGWSMLAEMTGRDVRQDPMPFEIQQVLSRARGVAAGRLPGGVARTRMRTPAGRWVVLDAAAVAGGAEAATAVTMRRVGPVELSPLAGAGHDLSPREREVATLVASGRTTSEIAAELFISQHTVRDHLKAIFDKVGVSSRGELVAELFAMHAFADLHAGIVHPDELAAAVS